MSIKTWPDFPCFELYFCGHLFYSLLGSNITMHAFFHMSKVHELKTEVETKLNEFRSELQEVKHRLMALENPTGLKIVNFCKIT